MPENLPAPLVRRESLGGAYVLLTFRHASVAREARAGQFVMIKAGLSAEPPLRRPFSIMAVDPREETFTLFVKTIGPGSRGLAALGTGEPAQCLGPLGRPFSPDGDGEGLFVAGGYGIAPLLLLAHQWPGAERPRVYYGARSAADIRLTERFDGLAELVVTTEDASQGRRGRVTEPLAERLASGQHARLFACGPEAMLEAVARLAERHDVSCQISLDPWMGCGVGTCLSCVVRVQPAEQERPGYRCACTYGPVFDSREVVWPGETSSPAARSARSPTSAS